MNEIILHRNLNMGTIFIKKSLVPEQGEEVKSYTGLYIFSYVRDCFVSSCFSPDENEIESNLELALET